MPICMGVSVVKLVMKLMMVILTYALRVGVIMHRMQLIMNIAVLLAKLTMLIMMFVAVSRVGLGLCRYGKAKSRHAAEQGQS